MTSDKQHLLDQIYSRLCFHCSIAPERFNHKRERFIASLAAYPEDLLCAAYHHVSHHLTPAHVPSEEEFIRFMAPEFHRRQNAEMQMTEMQKENLHLCTSASLHSLQGEAV